ncbi:unnamed protein product, partial [Mesorhabditis spiculigera]
MSAIIYPSNLSVVPAPPRNPTTVKTTVLPKAGCSTGRALDGVGGNCYTLLKKVTHADAKSQCQKLGGSLGSIHSEAMNKKVQEWSVEELKGSMAKDKKYSTLLGASSIQSVDYNYRWLDGTALNYTNWEYELLDNLERSELCLELTASGTWNDLACGENARIVCEKSGPCATGWKAGSTKNLCYLAVNKDVPFAEADKYCKAKSATLPIVRNKDQNKDVIAVWNGTEESIWLNAKREKGMEKEFSWDDRTPVDYTNWVDLEPNDYEGASPKPKQENCIEMYLQEFKEKEGKGYVGQWNQLGCAGRTFDLALCKVPNGATATPQLPNPLWKSMLC